MNIPIERLTPDTLITIPTALGPDFAFVETIHFDGEGYSLELRFPKAQEATEGLYVNAGGSVEYAGRSAPVLRNEDLVALNEWRAKIEANDTATNALIAKGAAMVGEMRNGR